MKIKNKKLPKKQNNYKYYLDIFYLHICITRSSLVNAIGLGNSLSSFKSLVTPTRKWGGQQHLRHMIVL